MLAADSFVLLSWEASAGNNLRTLTDSIVKNLKNGRLNRPTEEIKLPKHVSRDGITVIKCSVMQGHENRYFISLGASIPVSASLVNLQLWFQSIVNQFFADLVGFLIGSALRFAVLP